MFQKLAILSICAGLAMPLIAHEGEDGHTHSSEDTTLKTVDQKASYAAGVRAGRTLKAQTTELDMDLYIQAINEVLNDQPLLMTDREMRDVNREIQRQRREAAEKERDNQVQQNLEKAEEFLAENKNKEGIITTSSGLQYKVVKEGDGASPSKTDRVNVHYEGRLIDGSVFDSSYQRGNPATFGVGQVISGWTEMLQLMKPGGEVEVYIHPDLAYGSGGNRSIEPNSLLIFKVELISVE